MEVSVTFTTEEIGKQFVLPTYQDVTTPIPYHIRLCALGGRFQAFSKTFTPLLLS